MESGNRRSFLKLSAAAWFFSNHRPLSGRALQPAIASNDKEVTVTASSYKWEWSSEQDVFRLSDSKGRLITTGSVQPRVLVKSARGEAVQNSAGTFAGHAVSDNQLTIRYKNVNGDADITTAWRFGTEGLWFDPVVYETATAEDVVSLHYFAAAGELISPSLKHTFWVLPGISESGAISPILPASINTEWELWLGHGDGNSSVMQQWGLPSHYFCGAPSDPSYNARGSLKECLSDAFCCGLAALPAGDLFLHTKQGACAPVLNIRSDLWGQARGPGRFTLGAPFYWAIAANYYEAIREYYRGLVRDQVIQIKKNSPAKNAVVTAPAFDTWGAEVAAQKSWARFDEQLLNSVYEGLKASAMASRVFVIDAKWEGQYGLLEHSKERFPHFEAFLATLKADGVKLGMWAAFMRCDDPAALGLEFKHMLRAPDGKPVTKQEDNKPYYLLDFTQPEVQRVLANIAKRFVQRYRPELVKFDFGYELPSLSNGAPRDLSWAGERLLQKGLDVVVNAMREVNPDIVVMYYSLSPLFINYFDLHSPDDMFLCGNDYATEANKRYFFSSLLGELGMPTYGSAGYDWLSVKEIWFDTAPIGSLGSLASFSGDEQDSEATPERVAKYNGLSQLTRTTNVFHIEPLDPILLGSLSGAHSSSWVRHENGEPVLIALRARRFDGSPGPGGYRDLIESTNSVVVASKTSDSLAASVKLGVVPYGDGELLVRHQGQATRATVTNRCLGTTKVRSTEIMLDGNVLRVPFTERLPDGSVVEWIEVELG